MSVGDVNSTERGSGARFNDGKPALDLIPLTLIAFTHTGAGHIKEALADLGSFQVTGDRRHLDRALYVLEANWRSCARVFEYGRKKYAAWNWAKGMAWSIPIACAARHALAQLEGEELDSESGLPHVGHFMCNLVMLRVFVDTFPEGNDLPPPSLFVPAPKLEEAP